MRFTFYAGMRVPFALRRLDSGLYRLVGELYFHGYINGEAFMRDGETAEDMVVVSLE
jgi:hypothetical protein